MHRIIILILIYLPLAGFSQLNQTGADGRRQGKWQKSYPNGRLMYEGYFKDGEPAGDWTRYYEGGQVKAKISYRQGSDTASAVLFDPLGGKMAEGAYVDEQRTGKWLFYKGNSKVSEESYLNGVKQGISRTFYPTGEVLEESEWHNGQQMGNYRVFFKDGKPYMQCKFADGKRNGLCLSYYPNGRVEMEAHYLNNLRHSDWKFYNENGELKYTLRYDKGNLLNPEVQDSIDSKNQKQFEKTGKPVTDPEDFLQDPSEYMMRMQNQR